MSSTHALNLSISLAYIRRKRRSRKWNPVVRGLAEAPTLNEITRRFRMSKALFLSLLDAIGSYDPYFTWKQDCTGKKVCILLLKSQQH
ncbi:hypothetical protein PPTG_20171 [Phytophthora nicotianae INRA-310]|uniref:Uncharacterized protein n=1 Tax=Phytophthora nicotianae (strain INRA-310) TaxID=761204 RepID=W2P982_PHYN3|nr:hypothetical protein PPTG_20171 [Phytophthora nicotianae INRA-310]ETM97597.1 hypothetical protein PPTG_20171 [Phytophthora nicotianae INRA-310]